MGVAQFVAGQALTALAVNQLPVVVSYAATGTLANSTAETAVGTFTIPAGDPTSPGGYAFNMTGSATETAGPTISIRVRLNSTAGSLLFAATGLTFSSTPVPWAIDGWFYFSTIGASGAFTGSTIMNSNFAGAAASVLTGGLPNSIAINTTISNTILVTAQFSAANAANTVTGIGGAMYRR